MFPYVVPDFDFLSYVYRKNNSGEWEPQLLEDALHDSDVSHIWTSYLDNYIVIFPLFLQKIDFFLYLQLFKERSTFWKFNRSIESSSCTKNLCNLWN